MMITYLTTIFTIVSGLFTAWKMFRLFQGAITENYGDVNRVSIAGYIETILAMVTVAVFTFKAKFIFKLIIMASTAVIILLESYLIHGFIPNVLLVTLGVFNSLSIPIISKISLYITFLLPPNNSLDNPSTSRQNNKSNKILLWLVGTISKSLPYLIFYSVVAKQCYDGRLTYINGSYPIFSMTFILAFIYLRLNLSDEAEHHREELFKTIQFTQFIPTLLFLQGSYMIRCLRTLFLKIPMLYINPLTSKIFPPFGIFGGYIWLHESYIKQQSSFKPLAVIKRKIRNYRYKGTTQLREIINRFNPKETFPLNQACSLSHDSKEDLILKALYQVNPKKFHNNYIDSSDPRAFGGRQPSELVEALSQSVNLLISKLRELNNQKAIEVVCSFANDESTSKTLSFDDIQQCLKTELQREINLDSQENITGKNAVRAAYISVCEIALNDFNAYDRAPENEKAAARDKFLQTVKGITTELNSLCANGVLDGFMRIYFDRIKPESLNTQIESDTSQYRGKMSEQYYATRQDPSLMHLSICNFTYHSSVKEIGTQDPTNRHVFNRYLNSNFEYYQSPLYELATRDLKAAMIGNPIYSYCSPIPLVEFCRNSVSSYIKPLLENEVLSSRTYTNIIKAFTKRETPFRNMVSFLTEFVIDWDDEYHHIFSHLAEKMLLETPDAHLFSFRDEIDAFLGRIHIDHTYALNASWFEAIKKNLRIQNIFSSPNSAIMDNGHINFDFVREQLSNEQLTDNEIARAYCRRLVRSASSHPSANNNPYSTLNGRYEFNGQDLEVNTISDEYLKSSVVALSDGSCLDNVCTYIILQKMLEQGHIVEHEDVHHPTIWSLFKDAFQDMCYLPIDIYNLLAYLSYVFCITTCSLMPKNLLPRSISLKRDYRSVTGYQKSQSPTPFSEISVLLKQN